MLTLNDFTKGDRIEMHPATGPWMRGARFGTVVGITKKNLRIALDHMDGKVGRVSPENIRSIIRHLPISAASASEGAE